MNVLNCTSKLFHRQKRPVRYKKRHECLSSSSYCTKSVTDKKGEYLMKNISDKPSSGQGFELKSAEQQLRDAFPNAYRRDFMDSSRVNEVNIQMLSRPLYEQIFGKKKMSHVNSENNKAECDNLIGKAKNELKKHGLWTEEVESLPDVHIKLPKLEGEDIEEHFWRIGQEQSEPYKELMCNFIKKGIPEEPKEWLRQNGWTKYKKGETPISVLFPDEDILVFDVEVSVKVGEAPVMAVAVSSDSWYGWVSPSVTEKIMPIGQKYVTDMLIPLEGEGNDSDRPRVVIGHNVSYDRARVKEQYSMRTSALRFMDTMSLHICVGGASSVQRTLLKGDNSEEDPELSKKFCLTSLKDVYSLYCNGELSKADRDVFVEGSLEDVREQFQDLMKYCSNDVKATFEVFRAVFPMYLERFPHPVTLAGMLEMGMAYLTVNNNWEKYIKDSQEKFEDLESEISFLLAKKCDRACRLMHNDEYKSDFWMWNEDWSTQELKLTKKPVKENPIVKEVLEDMEEDDEMKELMRRFKHLFDLETVLPTVRPLLPGYPAWYRKLCRKPDSPDWVPGPHAMHVTLTIAPKVLNLTYENYPLHYIRELGWGILVADLDAVGVDTNLPLDKLKEITRRNIGTDEIKPKSLVTKEKKTAKKKGESVPHYRGTAIVCNHKIDNCCYFLKLPHKDGNNKNVGQPLSKSFASVLSSHLLAGSDSVSSKGLSVNNMLSYWRNNRDRITSQMVVWRKAEERERCEENGPIGVIIPKIVVCGTLTRRAVEPTWLTASKAVVERLGSELRSMVQAPPGYHFVGADVDSQELWIASLIGDSHSSKVHGGTPFGWMTISGTKLKGTDLHSVTAKAAGISREHAKIINYARIYGAGVKFAEKLLQQFNPTMSSSDVKAKAHKMYTLTKGQQHFKLKEEYKKKLGLKSWQNITFNSVYPAMNFAKKYGSTAELMFEQRKWEGGTESAVFNELEKIANSRQPETPFLRSRLSRALEPRFDSDDQYMNTRINWVVQSGAVDFLHLMLVCMRWLTNGQVRYCLSFHDEVRYLVPSENRYQAALALQITNLLTRSFFAHRVGLYDLPLSVAFFSSVEVDKTLRKEADDDCVTPSNPHGLEKGYGIPKGESLTIYSALKKSGGNLSCFQNETTR